MTKSNTHQLSNTFYKYLQEIRRVYLKGEFTEMTFRTPFENFIRQLNPDCDLLHEPHRKKTIGAPDFRANRNTVRVGYIETKDLDKNLDEELESEQIKKYKESINSIILTNYHRFIFIRNNQIIFDISLFNINDLSKPKNMIPTEKINEFLTSIDWFFGYSLPIITTGEELALELSRKAKLLRDLVREQLHEDVSLTDKASSQSSVYDFFQGIKELINDITVDESADAYAQTMTYGLFLARIHSVLPIRRDSASSFLPRSISIIRSIFASISYNLPPNLTWIIDEIIDVMNTCDIKKVLSDIDFRDKKDRDPFSFFYEDFLARYDPKKRKALGVYYTPRPVISFIVKSVNLILKSNFNKTNGFAEDDVTVLDPAVGTGTFLWLVYLLTLVELKNKGLG